MIAVMVNVATKKTVLCALLTAEPAAFAVTECAQQTKTAFHVLQIVARAPSAAIQYAILIVKKLAPVARKTAVNVGTAVMDTVKMCWVKPACYAHLIASAVTEYAL